MFNINEYIYFARMQEFRDPQLNEASQAVGQWLDTVYYRRADDATLETLAGMILSDHPQLSGPAAKRYRFTTDKKSELLKIVFNQAFKKATEREQIQALISEAETASSTKIYFPKWKKFIRIHLPRVLGGVIGDEAVAAGVTQIAYYTCGIAALMGYGKALNFTNRVIVPMVLKVAPLAAVKAYPVINVAFRVYCIFLVGVAGCWVAKEVATRWRITSVTRLFRGVDFGSMLQRLPKPMNVFVYTSVVAIKSGMATMSACPKIGTYLKDMAVHAERDQEVQARVKALDVWMNMMKNRPEPAVA